jgi:hypothetical protein
MKKDILLLILFLAIVIGGFSSITFVVAKEFVKAINNTTINYFPEEIP